MNIRRENIRLSAITLAVLGTLSAVPALADEQEAQALMRPGNSVELGVTGVSGSSAKFGEYTGLNKSGASLLGNLQWRGGDAYDAQGGASRWSVNGSNLGLTSRSLDAGYANQGQWNIGIGYDELRHNLSDTYRTPYLGNLGDNRFALPAGFGAPSNSTTLTAAQLGAFRNLDIGTSRRNTSLTAGLQLNAAWGLKFDYNHLDQSGAKLMGVGQALNGTATNEFVAILPNPTNYKTDNFNLAVNWQGEKAHLTGAYYGSFFRDGYDRFTFQTWAGGNQFQNVSTAPSNNFNQFSLAGGYSFAPRTKLAGSLSYARNTQNDPFVFDSFLMVTPSPRSSASALVVNSHADLKLTDQTTRDLGLSAAYKYDNRDNRTPSSIYNFNAISGANTANYPNTPLSNKKSLLEFAGDYRINTAQRLRVAWDHEEISRWCNQYAVNAGYPLGTNCVVAKDSKEDKLEGNWKWKASEAVDLKLGYSWANRKTSNDPNAIAAFISVNGGLAGQNAGDFRGFYPFFDASRKEQVAKAGMNWQVSDKFGLGLGGKFTGSNYADSTYGVQKGNAWSLNLDATYAYSDAGSFSSYITQQHRQRDRTNLQTVVAVVANATRIAVPPNSTWTNKLTDDDTTFGLAFKQAGLAGGKVELSGDLSYSFGKTGYGTALNYSGLTTAGQPCSDPTILSCGNLPDIRSSVTSLKLTGIYNVDKTARIALRLISQRLSSTDFYYNGYQTGLTPTQVLPTNQQSGSYSINAISLSFLKTF